MGWQTLRERGRETSRSSIPFLEAGSAGLSIIKKSDREKASIDNFFRTGCSTGLFNRLFVNYNI